MGHSIEACLTPYSTPCSLLRMDFVAQLKRELKLAPLPLEGGHVRELRLVLTPGQAQLPDQETASDIKSSSIFYLLQGNEVSKWHRTLKEDEYFVWNKGTTPIILHEIDSAGQYQATILGDPFVHGKGATFQHLIKAGHWKAASLVKTDPEDYTLISCVTSPAFQWRNFELLSKDVLEQLQGCNPEIQTPDNLLATEEEYRTLTESPFTIVTT
eukprot:maker-scaffold78_size404448-snap-gene-2.12 protein:Tk10215 transcript:maker-scaffold78_size404448-snap-gene-2.12-mRNA-1 annotation:"hypothetical protein"